MMPVCVETRVRYEATSSSRTTFLPVVDACRSRETPSCR
jgi:hypothetical protein